MAIQTFVQGQARTDRKLFGYLGSWLVDKKVQEQLGMAITAHSGDLWLVSTNSKDEVRGFATGRILKSGSLHLRFLYTADDGELVAKTLITRVLTLAEEHGSRLVYTNDRKTTMLWPDMGFKEIPSSRGGNFVRWEKVLEVSS